MVNNILRNYYCLEYEGNIFFCDTRGYLYSFDLRHSQMKLCETVLNDGVIPYTIFNVSNDLIRIANRENTICSFFSHKKMKLPDCICDAYLQYATVTNDKMIMLYNNNICLYNVDYTNDIYELMNTRDGKLVGYLNDGFIKYDKYNLLIYKVLGNELILQEVNCSFSVVYVTLFNNELWVLSEENEIYLYSNGKMEMIYNFRSTYPEGYFARMHIFNEFIILLPSVISLDIAILSRKCGSIEKYNEYPEDFNYSVERVKYDRFCNTSNGIFYPNRSANYVLRITNSGQLEWIDINNMFSQVKEIYLNNELQKTNCIKENEFIQLEVFLRNV